MAAREPEPYEPDTGDPRIDAFMRAHHDPTWKPPKPKWTRSRDGMRSRTLPQRHVRGWLRK